MDTPCLWIERLAIVKISVFPNLIYVFFFQHNTKQKCSKLSCNNWQSDSKIYMEKQKIQNSKLNIEGEEQSQRTETIRL